MKIGAMPTAADADARTVAARNPGRRRRTIFMLGFLALLVAGVYCFDTELIPSESMLPTLKPGDQILTMRAWIAYPRGAIPARGDIVLFHTTAVNAAPPVSSKGKKEHRRIGIFRNEGEILIKRVVGLPGETIEVHGDDVLINGRPLDRNYKVNHWPDDEGEAGRYGSGAPTTLGNDELFVLGDNRENSDDSRYWGPLKRTHITGRYVRVMFHRELKNE